MLLSNIVWHDKEQFDEGSGTVDLLQSPISDATASINPHTYAARYPQDRLRSAEECFYHTLLIDATKRIWIYRKRSF